MFEFVARRNSTTDPGAKSQGDESPPFDLITVDVFYRPPLFWPRRKTPRSALFTRMGRAWRRRRRLLTPYRLRILQRIVLGLGMVLWLAVAILFYDPAYQPFPIPDLVLRSLLALIPALSWPTLIIEHRRLFRLNLYLVHPEAPDPHPMPVHTDPRELDLVLRMVDPHTRRSLLKDLPADSNWQVFPTRPDGRAAPGRGDVLVQQCNRLLRYAFLSRLPDSADGKDPGQSIAETLRQLLSRIPDPQHPLPVTLPPDIRSAQRHSLLLYIYYRQLRWYLTMILALIFWVLTCHLRGVFLPADPSPHICELKLYIPFAVLSSLAWLGGSLILYRKQRRDITTWYDQPDPPVTTAPTSELHPQQRHWKWIHPRFFEPQRNWEFVTSFGNPVTIAVTVMLVLYFTIVDIFA